ncbi:MAG: hypothetical protein ACREEW_05065 [Caulobacteraceae bacterium]
MYYDDVVAYARRYGVNPLFVLAMGIESGFGSRGTYLRTGDAFGLTNGGTDHMTRASSPAQNVKERFDLYGNQVRGVGDNEDAFVNGLLGMNPRGERVPGWRIYNTDSRAGWIGLIREGVRQMSSDLARSPPRSPLRSGQ